MDGGAVGTPILQLVCTLKGDIQMIYLVLTKLTITKETCSFKISPITKPKHEENTDKANPRKRELTRLLFSTASHRVKMRMVYSDQNEVSLK